MMNATPPAGTTKFIPLNPVKAFKYKTPEKQASPIKKKTADDERSFVAYRAGAAASASSASA